MGFYRRKRVRKRVRRRKRRKGLAAGRKRRRHWDERPQPRMDETNGSLRKIEFDFDLIGKKRRKIVRSFRHVMDIAGSQLKKTRMRRSHRL